jgi:CelD/BcsL family acetyltransferase involved in cellulose biosynthesis
MIEWSSNIYNKFDDQIKRVWMDLEMECHHYVFQCYDWLYHWQQTIGDDRSIQPVIVTVSHRGKVVALFPMALRRALGARIIEFLGGEQSDYNAPLIINSYITEARMQDIWDHVQDVLPTHDIKLMLRIPQFLIKKENFLCSLLEARRVASSYGLTLPQSIEELNILIPKKIRSDSKRQTKRLTKQGYLSTIIAETDIEYKKLLEKMIEQKRHRYQLTGVRDVLADPIVQNFYKGLIPNSESKFKIHLSGLILNETVLATHWGCLYKERFYFLMPAYDEKWKKYSPGRLLLEELMNWSVKNNIKLFDFSIGSEKYKQTYCNQQLIIYEHVKLISLLGIPYLLSHFVVNMLKNNQKSRYFFTSVISKYRKLKTLYS